MSIWFDQYGLRIGWLIGLIAAGVVVLVVVVMFAIARPLEKSECRQKAEGLGLPWRYGLIAGCRVQYEGRWLPLENIRFTEPTR